MLTLPLATLGCACEDEKPYTPFAVATSVATVEAPTSETEEAKPKSTPPEVATLAQPAAKWKIFDMELQAPPGLVFVAAVQFFQEDQSAEIFAWLAAPATLHAQAQGIDTSLNSNRSRGDLMGLYPVGASGRLGERIVALPSKQPLGGSCKLTTKMSVVGEQTLVLMHESQCGEDLLSGQPNRSLQVIQPQGRGKLLAWYALPPQPGEELDFSVQAADQDQDGHEDFEVLVKLTSPRQKSESARFSWIVRAAGASKDPSLPMSELKARAGRLDIASMRIKERAEGYWELDALRRLLFALCEGSEVEKVLDESGESLACGDLSQLHNKITLAQLRAALGEKRVSQAVGHYEHAAWYSKEWTAADAEKARTLLWERLEHEPLPQASAEVELDLHLPGTPHRSPLAFAQGVLLLNTGKELRQLYPAAASPQESEKSDSEAGSHEGGEGAPAKEAAPDWGKPPALTPRSDAGAFVQSALPSCERAEVQLALVEDIMKPPSMKPLALLAPRPANCKAFGLPPLPLLPLSYSGDHLVAVVAGELLASHGGDLPPLEIAYATSLGLVVQHEGKWKVFESDSLKSAQECSLGDFRYEDGMALSAACRFEKRAKLYRLEPATP